MKLIEK